MKHIKYEARLGSNSFHRDIEVGIFETSKEAHAANDKAMAELGSSSIWYTPVVNIITIEE